MVGVLYLILNIKIVNSFFYIEKVSYCYNMTPKYCMVDVFCGKRMLIKVVVILLNITMYLKKNLSLLILSFTSLVCSRVMFAFFNDPEGPNLLVVVVMAVVVFALSLPVYRHYSSETQDSHKRLFLPILTQVVVVTSIYFLFR